MPLSGGVCLIRRAQDYRSPIPSAENSRATSADWLKPRCHNRRDGAAPGPAALRRYPRSTSGAMNRAIVRASATLRPYLRRIATRATYRHRRPRRATGNQRRLGEARRTPPLGRHERQTASPTSRIAEDSTWFQQSGQKLCSSSTIVAATGAARRKHEIEELSPGRSDEASIDMPACRADGASHKRPHAGPVRPRIARPAPRPCRPDGRELFLHERAYGDCLERMAMMHRRFDRALLFGCPDPAGAGGSAKSPTKSKSLDPGPLFAARRGRTADRGGPHRAGAGASIWSSPSARSIPSMSLPLALARDPPRAAARRALIGAIAGGDSLAALRRAMRAADRLSGAAVARMSTRGSRPRRWRRCSPRPASSGRWSMSTGSRCATPRSPVGRRLARNGRHQHPRRARRAVAVKRWRRARRAAALRRRRRPRGAPVETVEILHFARLDAAVDKAKSRRPRVNRARLQLVNLIA